jgi:hypothetical protein
MALSRSQIERLGVRLVDASPPTADDLRTLHELLLEYGDALANAVAIAREHLGVTPTAREDSVKQAHELADMIATLEVAEQAAPDAPQLATARRIVRERLDEMRVQLARLG